MNYASKSRVQSVRATIARESLRLTNMSMCSAIRLYIRKSCGLSFGNSCCSILGAATSVGSAVLGTPSSDIFSKGWGVFESGVFENLRGSVEFMNEILEFDATVCSRQPRVMSSRSIDGNHLRCEATNNFWPTAAGRCKFGVIADQTVWPERPLTGPKNKRRHAISTRAQPQRHHRLCRKTFPSEEPPLNIQ